MDELKNISDIQGGAPRVPDTDRKKRRRKRIVTALFVLINISVIAMTAFFDFSKQGKPTAPLGTSMRFLFAAGGCFLILLAAEVSKYYVMLKELSGQRSVRLAFEVAFLGKYYDNITPTGAGGQPFQVYYLKQKGVPTGDAAAIPVAGFLTLQIAFIILAVIVFIFGTPYLENVGDYTIAIKISAYIGILFYAAMPALIIFFTVFPQFAQGVVRFFILLLSKLRLIKNPQQAMDRVIATLTEYRDSISAIYKKRWMLLRLLGFGLAYQVAMCSIPYFVLRAFGSPLPYFVVFSMMILIYCAITYIPTPGNSGVAEASFYALLSTLKQNYLFWAMLIWRFFSFYIFLAIGGGIFAHSAIESRRGKGRGGAEEDGP